MWERFLSPPGSYCVGKWCLGEDVCLTTHSRKGKPGHELRVWKWCSEPAIHLPFQSFLSLQETKAFTCQLPCILEHQMHTTVHARPYNLSWLWEASKKFQEDKKSILKGKRYCMLLSVLGKQYRVTQIVLDASKYTVFSAFSLSRYNLACCP